MINQATSPQKNDQFAQDVLNGLSSFPKKLSPIYLYDKKGSYLFEEITNLPEYYVTRVEEEIINTNADDVMSHLELGNTLIEMGSGSARKTKTLLRALLKKHEYGTFHPIDICEEILNESVRHLKDEFPNSQVIPHNAEYLEGLEQIRETAPCQKMIVFLGSNIGNFEINEAVNFLKTIRQKLNKDDFFLLGVDMLKDISILKKAYNDSKGITAQFNLNILDRMNRELSADFKMDSFSHEAIFNAKSNRIEMHIKSEREQNVHVMKLGKTFKFAKGETIHTESCHKFNLERLKFLFDQSGFRIAKKWEDSQSYFNLLLLSPIQI